MMTARAVVLIASAGWSLAAQAAFYVGARKGIFEKHGFIWGGRWYHYDTMHFEYRPELVGAVAPGADAAP